MKTLSPELLAHYASGATTLARLWRITRRDGEVYGFTDHDRRITYPLVDGIAYVPNSAFDASAVSTRGELNTDNLEAVGLLDAAGITAADIEAGRWDGAQVQILEVNWADLSMGHNVLRVGELGQVQRRGQTYTAELRGLMAKLANRTGRIVTPGCDAVFGDSRCGIAVLGLTVSATVTGVTSQRIITAAGLIEAAGHFDGGVCTFDTGANAGLAMEVKLHAAGGVITLQLPMPYAIAVDDTLTLAPGCDRSFATCRDVYDNAVNFRGFPSVPGQDQVLLVGGQ